jgi:hypothetical protein
MASLRSRAKAALDCARAQCGTAAAIDARKIDAFARPMTDKMTFLRIVISLYLPICALEPNPAELAHMAPITLLFCQRLIAGLVSIGTSQCRSDGMIPNPHYADAMWIC